MSELPLTTLGVAIGEHVREICELLDLDPNNVARLDIRPRRVTAEVFKLDDKGRKTPDTVEHTFAMRIEAG